MIPELAMRKNEHELIKLRKHWFILLRESFSGLLILVLPFIAAAIASGSGIVSPAFFSSALWVVLSSLWILLSVMLLATVWTNYILDIWLVSSRRIVHIEQFALFNREAVTLYLENVQDVSIATRGFIATILHFGTISVETAGAATKLVVFEGMPNPEHVKELILHQASVCASESHGVARTL